MRQDKSNNPVDEGGIEGVFARVSSVVMRRIGDEVLLVPVSGNLARLQQIYSLNSVGSFIWEQLDGRRSLEEIARMVAESFEVEPETAANDVDLFVHALLGENLVVGINGGG